VRSDFLLQETGSKAGYLLRGIIVALTLLVASCGTTPPVQEMSDARQAISVAIDAGAKERAAADLGAAQGYLDSAEKNLANRAYSKAREDAQLAKESALAALAQAEQTAPPE
jgi:hypothetical protein